MFHASSRRSGRLASVKGSRILSNSADVYSAGPRYRLYALSSARFSSASKPSAAAVTRTSSIPRPYWKPPPLPKAVFPKRTILIKGWTPLNNMVEVFAVLRAVEEKYGSIVEYVVSKDFEMPEKPFAMIFAAFADPASLKRVPAAGVELAVSVPSYKAKAGGVGWDDIENLLSEADRDPDYDRKHGFPLFNQAGQNQKHIFVRISAARKEISSNPLPVTDPPSPEMQRQIAEKFLKWAEGNKQLPPVRKDHVITDRELFGVSELDNVRLRAAIRWVRTALGKRSCLGTEPQSTVVEESLPEQPVSPPKNTEDVQADTTEPMTSPVGK